MPFPAPPHCSCENNSETRWFHRCVVTGVLSVALSGLCWATQPVSTGQDQASRSYEQGDFSAAFLEIQPAAEAGNPDAQHNLGVLYDRGLGVGKNSREALKWFRKAAIQGQPAAQYNLGLILIRGEGVPVNPSEAATWFKKSADQGLAEAQYSLGLLYQRGEGVPQNYREAIGLFRSAGEHGYPAAYYSLGLMYRYGEGVPASAAESRRFHHLAATLEVADA